MAKKGLWVLSLSKQINKRPFNNIPERGQRADGTLGWRLFYPEDGIELLSFVADFEVEYGAVVVGGVGVDGAEEVTGFYVLALTDIAG